MAPPPKPGPRVAVVGASGYAGRELCTLLVRDPGLHLARTFSAREDAVASAPVVEGAPSLEPLENDALEGLDGIFLCLPHGISASLARRALDAGLRVVDLSGDLRLPDVARWEAAYGVPHPEPALCDAAVYGLTEHARPHLDDARLVANPGCYPTSVLLPLLPLVSAGALDPAQPVVADCKSGVSGAGASPSPVTLFGNVAENFRAYGVGTHRHQPEIEHHLGGPEVVFVPHLLPCFRGILSTLYVAPAAGQDAASLRAALAERYADEPFVTVLPAGAQPELSQVQRTNRCVIGVADAGARVAITSALDNLVKGAAGQALQNMNRMLGRPETEGLA